MSPAQRFAFTWLTMTMPVLVFVIVVRTGEANLHSFLGLNSLYACVFWIGYSIGQTSYVHGLRYFVLLLLGNGKNLQLDRQMYARLVLAPMILSLLIIQLGLETSNATELALFFRGPFYRPGRLGESWRGVSSGGSRNILEKMVEKIKNIGTAVWKAGKEVAKDTKPRIASAEETASKGANEAVTYGLYPLFTGAAVVLFSHHLGKNRDAILEQQLELAKRADHRDSLVVEFAKKAAEGAEVAQKLAQEAKESVADPILDHKIYKAVKKVMEEEKAKDLQEKMSSLATPTLPEEPSESPSEPSHAIVSSCLPSHAVEPSSVWEFSYRNKIPAFVQTLLEGLFSTFPCIELPPLLLDSNILFFDRFL